MIPTRTSSFAANKANGSPFGLSHAVWKCSGGGGQRAETGFLLLYYKICSFESPKSWYFIEGIFCGSIMNQMLPALPCRSTHGTWQHFSRILLTVLHRWKSLWLCSRKAGMIWRIPNWKRRYLLWYQTAGSRASIILREWKRHLPAAIPVWKSTGAAASCWQAGMRKYRQSLRSIFLMWSRPVLNWQCRAM